ncbi:response regulator [Sphingomonas sp. H39-1-10]|uniref:response regulator transcription factor n=1 Tax=Sphingomonas pollutisoli TaxID=3030829 RepID=UPI0023B9E905|nr:response regulator [Sphingomonas pollutisoli]MDF0486640.1 response regulator [Sphingomonas pollutisoli]
MPPPSTIGVVDDDPAIRGSIDSFIRSIGMATMAFESAEGLLTSGMEGELACIVTDIHMPGLSGLDLQREMKRRGWPHPMILMTAFPTPEAREQAMRAGAIAFLTKPIDPDHLLDAIESITGRDRPHH